jgi:hypothetical protein
MSAAHQPNTQPAPATATGPATPPAPPVPLAEQTIPNLTVVRPDTPQPPPVPAEPVPSNQDKAKAWLTGTAAPWTREAFVPPDIVRHDRPSLQKLHSYGKDGTQTVDGPLRLISRAWSWFAMYHAARGYTRAWLIERPIRGVVFATLVIIAAIIPETRAVLTIALWPAHQVIELITDF